MKPNKKITACCLLFLAFFAASTTAQNVSNARFYQNGKQVYITYNLDKTADITVFCSADGGRTFGNALQSVSGDVGKNVTAGSKTIVWDVLKDVDRLVGDNYVFKVKASSVGDIEMVFVKGGTFTMGCTGEQGGDCDSDEKPTHSVTVSDFYIGKYEVTQKQWRDVMGNNPSHFSGCDNCPVERVSWNDIQEFLRKLNAKTGKTYRLPTEAEWEYAARGGNQSRGYKYSGSNTIGNVAWYDVNSYDKGSSHPDYGTHPIGQKMPNELGIYDMSGNVWEWCSDWFGSYSSSSQTNPKGPWSGSYRVLRGGSWTYDARFCLVAFRFYYSPDYRYFNLGVRLVLFP